MIEIIISVSLTKYRHILCIIVLKQIKILTRQDNNNLHWFVAIVYKMSTAFLLAVRVFLTIPYVACTYIAKWWHLTTSYVYTFFLTDKGFMLMNL